MSLEAGYRWALVDFGDTLVKEPFCTNPPPEIPDWEQHILRVYAESPLTDRWNLGEVDHQRIAERIARGTPLSGPAVAALMEADFRDPEINEVMWDFGREVGRAGRAAIVTVNPDVFSTVIQPHYGLDEDYPAIVTSWEERTLDKVELCRRALARLGDPDGIERAVLIDNMEANVEAFRAFGGGGYLFTTDEAFAEDRATHPALRALAP